MLLDKYATGEVRDKVIDFLVNMFKFFPMIICTDIF